MSLYKLSICLTIIFGGFAFSQPTDFDIKVKATLKIKHNKQFLKIKIKTSEPRDFYIYEDYSSLVDPSYLGYLYFYDSLIDVYECHPDSTNHYRFIENYPEILFHTKEGYYRYFIYDTLDLSIEMRDETTDNSTCKNMYSFKEPSQKEKQKFELSIHPKILEKTPQIFIYRDFIHFGEVQTSEEAEQWIETEEDPNFYVPKNSICIEVKSKIKYSLLWHIKNRWFKR